MTRKLPPFPDSTTSGDLAVSGIKVVVGAIPIIGPAISETIAVAVAAPAQKRANEWFKLVEELVNELIEKGERITLESLAQNEAFVTAVMSLSRAAILSDREDKRKLLGAVVYNVASGQIIDDFVRNTFLAIVERYTPEHVRLLRALSCNSAVASAWNRLEAHSPTAITKSSSGERSAVIENLAPHLLPDFPELVSSELFGDLQSDRLCLGSDGWAYTLTEGGAEEIVTLRGAEFLRFVSPNGEL